MLAGIAAITAAGEIFDLATAIIKLDLIRGGFFHDSPSMTTVNTEVEHTVLCILVMSTLRNGAGDLHPAEVVQPKAVVTTARHIDVILFVRGLEPGDDFLIGDRLRVKGYQVGAGHAEFSRDVGIRHSDHPLIIGELDLKAVIHSGHTPPQALQLAVHVDSISHLKGELVVVVG